MASSNSSIPTLVNKKTKLTFVANKNSYNVNSKKRTKTNFNKSLLNKSANVRTLAQNNRDLAIRDAGKSAEIEKLKAENSRICKENISLKKSLNCFRNKQSATLLREKLLEMQKTNRHILDYVKKQDSILRNILETLEPVGVPKEAPLADLQAFAPKDKIARTPPLKNSNSSNPALALSMIGEEPIENKHESFHSRSFEPLPCPSVAPSLPKCPLVSNDVQPVISEDTEDVHSGNCVDSDFDNEADIQPPVCSVTFRISDSSPLANSNDGNSNECQPQPAVDKVAAVSDTPETRFPNHSRKTYPKEREVSVSETTSKTENTRNSPSETEDIAVQAEQLGCGVPSTSSASFSSQPGTSVSSTRQKIVTAIVHHSKTPSPKDKTQDILHEILESKEIKNESVPSASHPSQHGSSVKSAHEEVTVMAHRSHSSEPKDKTHDIIVSDSDASNDMEQAKAGEEVSDHSVNLNTLSAANAKGFAAAADHEAGSSSESEFQPKVVTKSKSKRKASAAHDESYQPNKKTKSKKAASKKLTDTKPVAKKPGRSRKKVVAPVDEDKENVAPLETANLGASKVQKRRKKVTLEVEEQSAVPAYERVVCASLTKPGHMKYTTSGMKHAQPERSDADPFNLTANQTINMSILPGNLQGMREKLKAKQSAPIEPLPELEMHEQAAPKTRRTRKQVCSYAEPALNKKLRRN